MLIDKPTTNRRATLAMARLTHDKSTKPPSSSFQAQLLGKFLILFISSTILLQNVYIFRPNAVMAAEQPSTDQVRPRDTHQEDLFIKPLADGKLFTQFQFKTIYGKDMKSLRWENEFQIFPLSLADLVATSDLNKLHFSLTKGNWNYRNWGYAPRPSPPGAQIRVQLSQHNEDPGRSWKRLVNLLAGKFCASLASADHKNLVSSKLAFGHHSNLQPNSTKYVLYSNLPEESLCTENLTPWKKLLPCYFSSGLASLLNSVNLLKSSHSSLAIDLERIPCQSQDPQMLAGSCENVQLVQTIEVVFNPLHLFEGKQTWSLAKIFGNSIQRICPLASKSQIHVDITDLDDKNKLYPKSYREHELNIVQEDLSTMKRIYATFDVNSMIETPSPGQNVAVNVGVKQTQLFKALPISARPTVPVHLRTHVSGMGTGDGTIVATVSNNHEKPIRVTYMDVIPHFLQVFLHTLTIRTKSGQELKPDKLNFVLSKDQMPTLIEFSIVLPAASETQISYDFKRTFLRWTEHRADSNKGTLLSSAVISISPQSGLAHLVFPVNSVSSNSSSLECSSNNEGDVLRVYARPLLIILPTPDFSMPYNVICLVCSVLVAAFGSIHSTTTRKPVIKVSRSELEKQTKQQEQQSCKEDDNDQSTGESKKDQ